MFNSYRYQSQPRITGFRWKTSLLFGVPDRLINRIGIVIIRADDLFGERLHACRAPTKQFRIFSVRRTRFQSPNYSEHFHFKPATLEPKGWVVDPRFECYVAMRPQPRPPALVRTE
jgi:hypothetical protein